MTFHRQIMNNAAIAVADSTEVLAYCKQNFGKGIDVNVGAYAQGIPSAEDSPFLWIQPKEENEAVNQDTTFTVRMVVGGCVKGNDGEKVIMNRIRERTAEQNGLTLNGGNEIVERLRDIIMGVVRNAKAGARVVAMRKDENDISHFPLEWSTFYVDYFEEESLSNILN